MMKLHVAQEWRRQKSMNHAHKRLFFLKLLLPLLLLAFPVLLPQPALAVDVQKVAASMAQQAGKAYEAGDYVRAFELYLNAFRSDPVSAYLFGAARSAHLAGQHDQATELYHQYLNAPNAEPERKQKAQGYLAEIDKAKVASLSAEADRLRTEDPKLAASLYLDALKLAPTRVDLLYKAAVAEQQAGDLPAAEQHLTAYLAKAPAEATERSQAQARLDSIRRKLHPEVTPPQAETPKIEVKPEPVPEPPKPVPNPPKMTAEKPAEIRKIETPVTVQKPPESQVNWAGWSVTAGGAALTIGGLVVLLGALGDKSQLNSDIQTTNPAGQVTKLTREEADAQVSAINTRMGVGAALTGAGVVAAGVGTWLLVRTPARVTILPQPGGAVLAWRF